MPSPLDSSFDLYNDVNLGLVLNRLLNKEVLRVKQMLWPNGAPLTNNESAFEGPSITAFLAEQTQSNAAVIVCPGGGYQGKAAHEGEPIAKWLNEIGIHAFVLDYRVAGEGYHHPCALLDVQRAVRTVKHNAGQWGINPDKIAVLGFSAGGHLAAMSGVYWNVNVLDPADDIDLLSARPDRLILCYPVITDGQLGHQGSFDNFVGTHPEYAEQFALDRSVASDTPASFIWHTSDDASVDVRNSLLFAAALREHEVLFDLHVYEHGRHGMGLAADDEHVGTWTEACRIWLRKNGY